jgi:hypothetical protein
MILLDLTVFPASSPSKGRGATSAPTREIHVLLSGSPPRTHHQGRGQQWSLRPNAKSIVSGPVRKTATRTYLMRWSLDPAQYDPMCIDCHRERDGFPKKMRT